MLQHLDHTGIAVRNLDESIKFYRETFGFQVDLRETVPSQKTELAFLKLDNTMIELLAASEESGPIFNFIQKRGPGLHHLCYRVEDIRGELTRLSAMGIKLIDREPRAGAHNTLIAFIHPASAQGVLTELCQHL